YRRKTLIAEPCDQLVHERILGLAQCRHIDARGHQEFVRVDGPAVRRVENNRRTPADGLRYLKGRGQIAPEFVHRGASSGADSPRFDHFSPALWVKPGAPAKRHFTFTRNLPEIGLMVGTPSSTTASTSRHPQENPPPRRR